MQTIVIIDDARVNIQVYQRILKRVADTQTISFTASPLRLSGLVGNVPDLVIPDYRMPKPDGLEPVRAFRAQPHGADVPIIMITSVKEREVRHKALDLGVDDFLEK